MRCNKPVMCRDDVLRPCRLPKGHTYTGCNPFNSEALPDRKPVQAVGKEFMGELQELVGSAA